MIEVHFHAKNQMKTSNDSCFPDKVPVLFLPCGSSQDGSLLSRVSFVSAICL